MPVTAFRLAAAILFALVLAAPAQAETIVHGTAVAAGEASPTGGSFSIRFPIEFKDVEFRVADPNAATVVVHMLSGVSREGIRFSATETRFQGQPKPIDSLMETASKRPGASLSDVRREQKDDMETLSFSLSERKIGNYFCLIRSKTTEYVLVVQFPNAEVGQATRMKDDFYGSFKMTRP